MLTKSDLQAIGHLIRKVIKEEALTKDEAKNFVTKDDAKRFATKDDLKRFATKDDLKRFATKDDLIGLAKSTEIDELRITFVDNLAQWKDELFTKIDGLVSSLKPTSEEQTVISGRLSEHSNTLENHETRIGKLEEVLQTQNP